MDQKENEKSDSTCFSTIACTGRWHVSFSPRTKKKNSQFRLKKINKNDSA